MSLNDSNPLRQERKARGAASAEFMMQDLRFAWRTLRKSWGFAATATLTLALGIGANTAIFQLLDAVRLRNLPVADPARLAAVRVKNGTRGFGFTTGDNETMLSYPMWEQIRLHQQSFSGVFAWAQTGSVSLGEGAQERRARGLWVSGEIFSVLGVPPLRGRVFTEKDDQPNCGLRGVVISYPLWQSEFGGQDSAIGSRLMVEGRPTEVIGVTPRGFFGLEVGKTFDFAVPFCSLTTYFPAAETMTRSDLFWLRVEGRLKPGGTLEQASSQLGAMSPGFIEATLPSGFSSTSLNVYKNFRLAAYPRRLSRWKRHQLAAANLRHFAVAVARNYRTGAAYCLRQSREPHAGPGQHPRAGNGRAARAWRFALEAHPPIVIGRISACRTRRGAGHSARGNIQQELGQVSQHGNRSHPAEH